MNTKLISKLLTGTIAVAMLAMAAFAVPATYADDGTPPATPTPGKTDDKGKPDKEKVKEALARGFEKQYERVVKNAKEFKAHLDKANDIAKKAQEFIAERKSKGYDTTAAETALTNFNADLKQAQASYDEAKKVLDTHAGFDAAGKLTDRVEAKETLLAAAKPLREGQKTLDKAARDMQRAIKQIRTDKKNDKDKDEDKDKPKPSATPKP